VRSAVAVLSLDKGGRLYGALHQGQPHTPKNNQEISVTRSPSDDYAGIAGMLRSGMSLTAIQGATGCSRATIAKVAKRAA
jgi:hypothetical protein